MSEDTNIYENLSIQKIKESVKEIKSSLPKENRNIITFSRNFTLSLSNYCQNQCKYCFYNYKVAKLNGLSNTTLLENEQMISLVQKAVELNCREALLMSGERPDSFNEVIEELRNRKYDDYIQFVIDICSYLLNYNLLPHTNIGVLTFGELQRLKNSNASMGLMLESSNKELFKKGAVHEISPGKLPEKRIEHIKNAGKLKIPFTTGLLLGIGESFKDRINDLLLIKNLHDKYGHIQEVIIQNFVEKEGIQYHPKKPISIKETLKTAGIAKLIFGNEIAIQIPPNLIQGYEKNAIELGIDDFGGISPFTIDYINPDHPWPQIDKLKAICNSFGYELKERLPIYSKYIQKSEFCPVSIKKIIDNIKLDVANLQSN
ncbi:MAG: 7,8-didemethyl-8-hydroxy-5-deazariboflavin synthase subunit CofG [Candidatus Hodarchaeota archaeon]